MGSSLYRSFILLVGTSTRATLIVESTVKSAPRVPHVISQLSRYPAVFTNKQPSRSLQQSHGLRQNSGAMADQSAKNECVNSTPKEENLPKLSAAEFRVYNRMAEEMDYYHNHFRQTWETLHGACTDNKRPKNMTLKQFLNLGVQFCQRLAFHHSLEEEHIYPPLAAKMPEFRPGQQATVLLEQHRQIHVGMDSFEEYLEQVKSGEKELELRVMKEKMDSWGEVLWTHLDQEVVTLGAENMRKYWSQEEMRRMPM